MIKLKVTPKAESDLIGIWVYTCDEWGADHADKYLDLLQEGMTQLVDHPLPGADYSYVLPEYRRLHMEYHLVFYQLVNRELLIVRVLHEDMDAPQRLVE